MADPRDNLIGERFHGGGQYGDITAGTYMLTYFHGNTTAGTINAIRRFAISDIDISAPIANTVYVGAGSTVNGKLIWKQWLAATGGVARTFGAEHLCPAGVRLWAKTIAASSVSIFVRGRLTT